MEQTPLSLFKSRIYDLLANRHKLQSVSAIGALSREDSALCTAIGLAAEQFQEETAMELAEASFDGIALTLLTVFEQGMPAGAKMASQAMQNVAEIIAKAGEDARSAIEQRTQDRGDDGAGDATPALAAAQPDSD